MEGAPQATQKVPKDKCSNSNTQEFVAGRGTDPTTSHVPRILQGMWLSEVGNNSTVEESQVWSGCRGGDSVPEMTHGFILHLRGLEPGLGLS